MTDKSVFIGTVQFKSAGPPPHNIICIAVKHIVSVVFPESIGAVPFDFLLYTDDGMQHKLISEMNQDLLYDYLFDYASYEARMLHMGKKSNYAMTVVIQANDTKRVIDSLKSSLSDTPLG